MVVVVVVVCWWEWFGVDVCGEGRAEAKGMRERGGVWKERWEERRRVKVREESQTSGGYLAGLDGHT